MRWRCVNVRVIIFHVFTRAENERRLCEQRRGEIFDARNIDLFVGENSLREDGLEVNLN